MCECVRRERLNWSGAGHKCVTQCVSLDLCSEKVEGVFQWECKTVCACLYFSVYSIVCVCVCGPALHCAGGQNTRDRFDLDSLCLVQSQSCHQLPTAGATHSWCREETLLHVITLYTLHFTWTILTKWLHLFAEVS